MDKNLDYYRSIQNTIYTNSYKEAVTGITQHRLDLDFYSTIDAETIVFENGNVQDVIITRTKNKSEFEMRTKSNETLTLGDVFEWQNNHWMITEKSADTRLRTSAKCKLCNYHLKWQNDLGEIIERWVISQDSSSYSSGIEGNKIIHNGADQIMIYVTCDAESLKVMRDKRLYVDAYKDKPTVYKITRPDTTTKTVDGVGYITWILSEEQNNHETDRIDLGICDYFDPYKKIQDFNINHVGKPQIRVGGASKTFTADIENVEWTINCLDEQRDYIDLTFVGNNQCKIKILNNENLIGSNFRLIATANGVSSDIIINLVGGI